jgi:hypothetical protein
MGELIYESLSFLSSKQSKQSTGRDPHDGTIAAKPALSRWGAADRSRKQIQEG